MAKLQLGKMIGPLPLGGWAAVVAGGLGIGFYARKRAAAAPANQALPAAGDGGTPTGGFFTTGPSLLPSNLPTALEPPASIDTNVAWHREATRKLVAAGFTAYLADQTLAKYLAAQEGLTADEQAIVETAIRSTGPPPSPPGLAPTGPKLNTDWAPNPPHPNRPIPNGATGYRVMATQAQMAAAGFSGGAVGSPWSEAWTQAAISWAKSMGFTEYQIYNMWAA